MSDNLERREFLRFIGLVVSSVFISSCQAKATELVHTIILTNSSTPTIIKSKTPEPIISQTETSTSTPEPTVTTSPTQSSTPTKIPVTLRDFADLINFHIGVLGGGVDRESYEIMTNIQQREFNATINYLGWNELRKNEVNYNWGPTDNDISFARKHNMEPLGHPLVWCQGMPDWISNRSFERQELTAMMVDHIKTVVDRYKEDVKIWSVVNEAFHQRGDVFNQVIGKEYIDIAFKTAREVDPSATLIYNDYENEYAKGTRRQITIDVIEQLRKNDLIDGVGLQMTLMGHNPPNKDDVIETMKSYGLPVYITEFAVLMGNVSGTVEQRYNLQAGIYQEMLEAAIESQVCDHFYIFGIGDKYSVFENQAIRWPDKNHDPSPFDDDLNPKPAYYSVLQVLREAAQST